MSANTAAALGEASGRSSGRSSPASSSPARARRPAAGARGRRRASSPRSSRCGSRVADAARRARDRAAEGVPLLHRAARARPRRPAGVVMALVRGSQVIVRGAADDVPRDPRDRGAGHGRRGRRPARRGDRRGRARRRGVRARAGHRAAGSRACPRPRSSLGRADRASSACAPSPAVALVGARGSSAIGNALLDVAGLTLLQRGHSRPARGRRCSRCSRRWRASALARGARRPPGRASRRSAIERALVITGLDRCRSSRSSAGRGSGASTTRASLPERQARLLRGDPAVRAAAAGRAGAPRRGDARRSTYAAGRAAHDPGRGGRHVRHGRVRAGPR